MDEAGQQIKTVTDPPVCASWFLRDGRLRSGWRILLYLISSVLLQVSMALVAAAVLFFVVVRPLLDQGLPGSEIGPRISAIYTNFVDYPIIALGGEGARLGLILALVWLFRRFVDRRTFHSLGYQTTKGWWVEALTGFGVIILVWAGIFAISIALGAATFIGWSTRDAMSAASAFAVGLILNVLVGIAEETDARGYVLQNLAEGIRFWPAVLVSSLYFGLLHSLNPGASIASALGVFIAGILLATGYYATGRLWFPIGMHAGWNLAQGPIFGFLVSGINMGGLVQTRVNGPDWLMGGKFGPEAGALAVAAEIVLIVVLFLWGWRNRHGAAVAAPA